MDDWRLPLDRKPPSPTSAVRPASITLRRLTSFGGQGLCEIKSVCVGGVEKEFIIEELDVTPKKRVHTRKAYTSISVVLFLNAPPSLSSKKKRKKYAWIGCRLLVSPHLEVGEVVHLWEDCDDVRECHEAPDEMRQVIF
jgi:hypothetical protein